jgi:hypothetical protein
VTLAAMPWRHFEKSNRKAMLFIGSKDGHTCNAVVIVSRNQTHMVQ